MDAPPFEIQSSSGKIVLPKRLFFTTWKEKKNFATYIFSVVICIEGQKVQDPRFATYPHHIRHRIHLIEKREGQQRIRMKMEQEKWFISASYIEEIGILRGGREAKGTHKRN